MKRLARRLNSAIPRSPLGHEQAVEANGEKAIALQPPQRGISLPGDLGYHRRHLAAAGLPGQARPHTEP